MPQPTSTPTTQAPRPHRVVIVGAGVAGLEATFALRELAGAQVALTILSDVEHYVDRPMTVAEPFTAGQARHYPLAPLAAAAGAELVHGELRAVDPESRRVATAGGAVLGYDELIVCPGARRQHRYEHTTRFEDDRLDEVLHGLVQDVEGGYVRRLAVIVPAPMPWPLPAYELALMASERAWEVGVDMDTIVFTPETSPLRAFGAEASRELSRLLAERRIDVVTSAYCEVPQAQTIIVHPGNASVHAERIVSLPALVGPAIQGLPQDGSGFIPVDEYGRVTGVPVVWAAGDATDYPVKQGTVAAQLAETVAAGVAAAAGAEVRVAPFAPVLEGVLLTGGRPRYIQGRTDPLGHDTSEVHALDSHRPPKIAARHLRAHLREIAPTP